MKIEAFVTYQQIRDEKKAGGALSRTSSNSITMTTSFFLRITEPNKDGLESKLMLSWAHNSSIGSLPNVFSEMFEAQRCDETFKERRNISFQYHDGAAASILVSKDEKKIRVQACSFDQHWLVLKELTEKLEETFRGYDIFDIVTFDEQIPLKELFEIIDQHNAIRKESTHLRKMLESRTVQFRMIQKRLLNRFKDKNPSPLNNMDFLLNHTYEQIIEMALRIEEHQKASKVVAQQLACCLEVVLLLIKIKARLPEDQYEILRSYLSPCIDSESETGWEEATLASVLHLIKTSLSGQSKSSVVGTSTTKMQELSDTTKLKANIQTLVDKLTQPGIRIDFNL